MIGLLKPQLVLRVGTKAILALAVLSLYFLVEEAQKSHLALLFFQVSLCCGVVFWAFEAPVSSRLVAAEYRPDQMKTVLHLLGAIMSLFFLSAVLVFADTSELGVSVTCIILLSRLMDNELFVCVIEKKDFKSELKVQLLYAAGVLIAIAASVQKSVVLPWAILSLALIKLIARFNAADLAVLTRASRPLANHKLLQIYISQLLVGNSYYLAGVLSPSGGAADSMRSFFLAQRSYGLALRPMTLWKSVVLPRRIIEKRTSETLLTSLAFLALIIILYASLTTALHLLDGVELGWPAFLMLLYQAAYSVYNVCYRSHLHYPTTKIFTDLALTAGWVMVVLNVPSILIVLYGFVFIGLLYVRHALEGRKV